MNAENEVLRYLGHRGQALTDELLALVRQGMAQCREVSRPLHVEALLTAPEFQFRGAQASYALAATLGMELERTIQRLELTDISRALVMDACATQYIEEICDGIESELCEQARAQGCHAGRRFSPGYAKIPLALQPDILRALDAPRRIGLMATSSLILTPRKSVTALVPLYSEPVAQKTGCANCNLRASCPYRCETERTMTPKGNTTA